jgi:hypothetical protein
MRRPLTLAGGDVEPIARLADGRARVAYLDREGGRTVHTRAAWPHELRGLGWHLTQIKQLIAGLPLDGAPAQAEQPAPRPLLFAHHAAAHRDDD